MTFGMTIQSFAASTESTGNMVIHIDLSDDMIAVEPYDSDWMYDTLASVGFTNEEMLELYQREADETGVSIHLPDALAAAVGVDSVFCRTNNGQLGTYASTPSDGDVRQDTYVIDFDDVADALGRVGNVADAASYIITHSTLATFTQAMIVAGGLDAVSTIITVIGLIYDTIDPAYEGVTITTTSVYYYDQYEGFGKWYLTDATYQFW